MLSEARRPVGHHRVAATLQGDDLKDVAASLFADGMRLALVSGHDDGVSMRAVYLFTAGPPDHRVELHVPIDRSEPEVPTLAAISFPASRFERELPDLFGICPSVIPSRGAWSSISTGREDWHPMRHGSGDVPPMVADGRSFPFVPVEGTGVYEIPVGPVHAGLIEPGHFRFWVVGETILRMKARLWFVHKGIERHFQGEGDRRGPRDLAERISGDTAVGHGLAYCQAVEDAWQTRRFPRRPSVLRAVLLELERLYNHVADIGALCNDVGFGLAQAWALDLREQLLRLNRDTSPGIVSCAAASIPVARALLRCPHRVQLAEITRALRAAGRPGHLERSGHGPLHRRRRSSTMRTPSRSRRRRSRWPSVGSRLRRPRSPTSRRPRGRVSRRRSRPAATCWPASGSGSTRCGRHCDLLADYVEAAATLDDVVTLIEHPSGSSVRRAGSVSPRAGGVPSCTGSRSTTGAGWSESRWSTRRSSTGRLSRSRWRTRSSRTFRSPTRASTSPMPGTISDGGRLSDSSIR